MLRGHAVHHRPPTGGRRFRLLLSYSSRRRPEEVFLISRGRGLSQVSLLVAQAEDCDRECDPVAPEGWAVGLAVVAHFARAATSSTIRLADCQDSVPLLVCHRESGARIGCVEAGLRQRVPIRLSLRLV